jgi:lipopolysaccharide transport system permease protein
MLYYFRLLVIMLAGLGLGFGLVITSMTTKYRDLVFLLQFGIQLAMYATPVIYPLKPNTRAISMDCCQLNPMTPSLKPSNTASWDKGTFSWDTWPIALDLWLFIIGRHSHL